MLYTGHYIDVFILLDSNTSDIKQTFWRYNYSDNPYAHLKSRQLKKYIDNHIKDALHNQKDLIKNINIRNPRLESPAQYNFSARDGKYPVTDKQGK